MLNQLNHFLSDNFSQTDIEDIIFLRISANLKITVAFRLDIDYEEFVRESKSGTIRELILLCHRRKLVGKLFGNLPLVSSPV